jgi:DNA (cytosine-5)-methyltransferase 1
MRTPTASQGEGGALGEEEARKRGNTVGIRDQALDLAKLNGEKVTRALFPTPVAQEGTKAPALQTSEQKAKTGQVWLSNVAKDLEPVLPTPTVSDNRGAAKGEVENGNPKSRLKVEVELFETQGKINWGKFEPAIRRWEEVLGRKAPAPTKPDGTDNAHRLSSLFTEWLMGLPEGWITDVGLTRNEELKACGNGVVPQQAELALRVLLEGVSLPTGGGSK